MSTSSSLSPSGVNPSTNEEVAQACQREALQSMRALQHWTRGSGPYNTQIQKIVRLLNRAERQKEDWTPRLAAHRILVWITAQSGIADSVKSDVRMELDRCSAQYARGPSTQSPNGSRIHGLLRNVGHGAEEAYEHTLAICSEYPTAVGRLLPNSFMERFIAPGYWTWICWAWTAVLVASLLRLVIGHPLLFYSAPSSTSYRYTPPPHTPTIGPSSAGRSSSSSFVMLGPLVLFGDYPMSSGYDFFVHLLLFLGPFLLLRYLNRRLQNRQVSLRPSDLSFNSIILVWKSKSSHTLPMPVLIVGGGIMAASTAYYLSKLGRSSIILERETIGCSASGKAGGFLARGWSSGPTRQLHFRGFDLIEEYAKEHGLISYRKIPTAQTQIRDRRGSRAGGEGGGSRDTQCSWLDRGNTSSTLMDSDTAQITPLELTQSLIQEATSSGMLQVRTGVKVVDVVVAQDRKGGLTGVLLSDGTVVDGTEVVLAMGAWLCEAETWPSLKGKVSVPMSGIKSSSIIYKSRMSSSVPDVHALFCSDDDNGCHLEVYPRPDGDIYICGLGGSPHLEPDTLRKLNPCDVQPEVTRVSAGHKSLSALTSLVDPQSTPDVQQACLRPILPDALPAIGCLSPSIPNMYMIGGHNCWGILWSLVSGEAMADIIADGKPQHIKVNSFNPSRFTPR
ncbi:hypothetical protein FOL47_001416 [Perkinsus chesapeaki]|uniref:FAD dependent oxidoreductase domain-containing protein n=1 Tax=Perkinsus chesapeaki TaxID=330153 RepID=A0A7J6MKS2_PERCH|nr:hypothetical protein FOL47_001416 [Perkinsus chesapeaki]